VRYDEYRKFVADIFYRIILIQWRTEGGGVWCVQPPPPPKFRRPSKIVPTSTRLRKLLKIAEFRKPKPQDVRKKISKILKLPPVRNCFTLAMTNKLVVIISSLKVTKIKKILLYVMTFIVPNYSCPQNPWLGGRGLPPPDPHSLCPQSSTDFVDLPNKIPGYTTVLISDWISWMSADNRLKERSAFLFDIYIYIYINIYIYIHAQTHAHTHTHSWVSFCDRSFHDDSLLRPLSSRTQLSRLVVHHCRNSNVLSLLSALLALFRCACVSTFYILLKFF